MRRLLRKKNDKKARDLRKVSKSLNALRDRFRAGELQWREYILHGGSPYSLTSVAGGRSEGPQDERDP